MVFYLKIDDYFYGLHMVYQQIIERKKQGHKSLAVLIDPDKVTRESCAKLVNYAIESKVDYFFVGGSLIADGQLSETIGTIKEISESIPVIIFPGSNLHIDESADAILLLSLISGRNPELLIGQHVVAAPILKKSKLEVLSTGYMLIDGGNSTTVSYISNTTPIPSNKPEIALCTAMAGEMLGMKLIYLDGGSGALNPVDSAVIKAVSNEISLPLIVGGGINTEQKVIDALEGGADVVVVGTGIEKNPDFLVRAADKVNAFNSLNVHK